MTSARLFCKTGTFAGKEFDISSEALIGRSQTNTVALSSDAISNHHARIFYDKTIERFVLEDLGSRNGTRLDGMRVRSPEPLDQLNIITFADAHDFIFQIPGVTSKGSSASKPAPTAMAVVEEETILEEAPVAPPPVGAQAPIDATVVDEGAMGPIPGAPAPIPAQPVSGAEHTIMDAEIGAPPAPIGDAPSTEANERTIMEAEIGAPPEPVNVPEQQSAPPSPFSLHIPKTGASFPLIDGEHTIGRIEPCEIVISDSSISRKHARLVVSRGMVTITDLGSKNGVTVNGSKIQAPSDIKPGDSIRIGEVDVELRQ